MNTPWTQPYRPTPSTLLGVPLDLAFELQANRQAKLRRQADERIRQERINQFMADRQAEHDRYQAAVGQQHTALLALVDEPSRQVLEHHQYVDGDCDGCDVSGYEPDQPGWPCSTYQLVAEHYGVTFSSRPPIEMTVPGRQP